jgi:predicted FMN-binding regulatory protein PaiB
MQGDFTDLEYPDDDEDVSDDDDLDLEEEEPEDDDTVVFSSVKGSDNIGDVSVEINVEELIAELEASQDSAAARKKEVRRRLEEIWEQREAMKELEDTFSFDFNDDD